MIQSVDSLSLAQEINKRADEAGKTMPVLLEVNLAGEASKFGYKPPALLAELNQINALPRIEIHGLVILPPRPPDAEASPPHSPPMRKFHDASQPKFGTTPPHPTI